MIILGASLLTLNPLFITLNIAFVSPQLANVSKDISYLHFQSHPYNHLAAVIIVTEKSRCLAPVNGQKKRRRGWTDWKEEGTAEAKRQADFISVPRLLPLKAEVQRVVGNCHVFH